MTPVFIKDDAKGGLTISDDAIFYALYKGGILTVAFDKGSRAEDSNKTDEVYSDSSATYDDMADFLTNTTRCIELTGINASAGAKVGISANSFKAMAVITGGARVYFNSFSNTPDYLEVSDTVSEIAALFEVARQAEITETP